MLPRLDLAIDPELSYGIVMKLISSAKKSGWHQCGVVMMVAGKPMLVPIDLPDWKQLGVAHAEDLHMIVTVTPDEFVLWSSSGVEGTQQKPIGAATKAATIATAVGEVVRRHWPTETPRPGGTGSILVIAPNAVPMQRIADVLAAVRKTSDGHDLFPDVEFGMLFE